MESGISLHQYFSIGILIFAVSLIIYLKLFTKNPRKTIKELALSMGWEYKGNMFTESIASGAYNGISARIRYWPGSKYRTSYFKIEFDIDASFEIRISKENFMHKLGKKTGLAIEIETGDQFFDEKYFLRASDDYNAQLYMQKSSVREAVTAIVDTGFSIDIDRQKIGLTACVLYSKLADVFLLKNILDNAYRLIKELP